MNWHLNGLVAISASTFVVLDGGCASSPLVAVNQGRVPAPVSIQARSGTVAVPLSIPALAPRSVQYIYNNNYINTVEVRLRDSLGGVQVQDVCRNAYQLGSTAAGTVNVAFTNVMPGTFTLTIRTSQVAILGSALPTPIQYDDLRDVFFRDVNANNQFDAGEQQFRTISGTGKYSQFIIFDGQNNGAVDLAAFAFPNRKDSSATPAGYGIGAATGSIVAGQTTSVGINVSQPASWATPLNYSVREVTAGDIVTLPVVPGAVAGDQVLVARQTLDPTTTDGIIDIGSSWLNGYPLAVDNTNATMSFQPTRGTYVSALGAYSPWNMWLGRGETASEVGGLFNIVGGIAPSNLPQINVLPALASQANCKVWVTTPSLSVNNSTTIDYDLRDTYSNPVAGNVNENSNLLTSLRRANAGLSMEYSVVGHQYATDPTNNLSPFIVPGLNAGSFAGGTYTQGGSNTAFPASPAAFTSDTVAHAAAYTVGGPGSKDLQLIQLEVPYAIWNGNRNLFTWTGAAHLYTLGVIPDPSNASNLWVSLYRGTTSGTLIASSSVTPSSAAASYTVALQVASTPGLFPVPALRTNPYPVVLRVPATAGGARSLSAATDNGMTFTVTDYGRRRVGDTDTILTRVLNSGIPLMQFPIPMAWQQ